MRVAPGTRLRFSGWFKTIGTKGGTCRVNFEGDPGDCWASLSLPTASNYEWTEVLGIVTVPKPKSPVAGNIEILVFIYIKTYGGFWIDDGNLPPRPD